MIQHDLHAKNTLRLSRADRKLIDPKKNGRTPGGDIGISIGCVRSQAIHLTNTTGLSLRTSGRGRSPKRRPNASVIHCVGAALAVLAATGCSLPNLNGDGTNPSADGTYVSELCESEATPIPRAQYGVWVPVVLNDVIPGDEQFTCGNGDPYKFFVQYNTSSTNLTIAFEPGGACWDVETCNGQAGRLSTVRLGGVPDDLMTDVFNKPWAAMYPHFGRIDNSVATNYYNHVFFPYCTGDAFTGGWYSEDPAIDAQNWTNGYENTTVRHHGRRNIEAASRWLAETFPAGYTGQLLVMGSSAGSVGATVNYPLLRDTLAPKCGAMIADAGPIFPPKGGLYPPYQPSPQEGILDRVSDAWHLQAPHAIVAQLDNRFGNQPYRLLRDHFGHINRGLARAYPHDRFLMTTFKQDLDFSLFSFVAAGPIAPGTDIAEDVIEMWNAELDYFQTWIHGDSKQNWGYYMPNFRHDWCSHMVATAAFTLANDPDFRSAGLAGNADGYRRSEVGDMDFGDVLRTLLDPSQPIPRVEATYDPTQLTYLSEPGQGVSNEDWYALDEQFIADKQAYIDAQKQSCVFTNGYPH